MTLAQFRTRVRAYANDPATGGTFGKTGVNELNADAMIDAIGAEEYKESCNFLRRHAPGFFQKTLVSATSSTQQNSWPADFVRLAGPIIISDDGSSLETDQTVGSEVPRGAPGIIHSNLTAGQQIWVPEQGGFRLYPKVTTTGLKALLLRYEYIPAFPSTGSASFTWPDNHSSFLVIKTADTLRGLNGLSQGFLQRKAQQLAGELLMDLKTLDLDPPQFPSSFYDDAYTSPTKHGLVK